MFKKTVVHTAAMLIGNARSGIADKNAGLAAQERDLKAPVAPSSSVRLHQAVQ
jgi:hypothetical protein